MSDFLIEPIAQSKTNSEKANKKYYELHNMQRCVILCSYVPAILLVPA